MQAVRLLVRAELRRRWRTLAVLALLVGFAGAATLGAVAGARRTSSSFERFLDVSRSQDALLFATDVTSADVEGLRSLPGVEAVGYARQLALVRPDGEFLAVGGPLDDVLFRDIGRVRIVEGRAPAPGAVDEVAVPEPLAATYGLRPGDELPVRSFTQEQIDALVGTPPGTPPPEAAGPRLTLRVVGVSRSPIDLSLQGTVGGVLLLPRAFVEEHGNDIGNISGAGGAVLYVRMTDGAAAVPRFLEQVRRVADPSTLVVDPAALTVGGVQDSIDVLAVGVLVFGAIAAISGLIALGLTIGRQVALLASGQAAVRDLGLSRSARTGALAIPVLLAITVGAVLAVLGAWMASPLLPFGVARRAEPDPGLDFDVLVLVVGAIAIVGLLAAMTVAIAWQATRAQRAARDRVRLGASTRAIEGVGAPPVVAIGVRMALEPGRGATAVPVRSALVGVVVAVLGVSAVAVFSSSLDDLVATPRAFGVGWDVRVADGRARFEREQQVCGAPQTRLVDEAAFEAIANACALNVTLDGRAIGAVGLTGLRGTIEPTVLEGRAPRRVDEVALGTETMRALGVDIGDQVTGAGAGERIDYEVVGRAVVPTIGDPQATADGAVFTGDGLAPLDSPGDVVGESALVVRFRPGADVTAATARLRALPGIGAAGVIATAVPLEVERLEQVSRVPLAVAAFLTILGAVAVGHLLVTSVQRRRRDFAILKSIGLRRSQVSATVVAQATTVAGIGAVVGLVFGLVTGSVVWRATADRVGLLASVEIPVAALAGVVVATIVIVNAVAAFPARRAARTQPAVLLRTE